MSFDGLGATDSGQNIWRARWRGGQKHLFHPCNRKLRHNVTALQIALTATTYFPFETFSGPFGSFLPEIAPPWVVSPVPATSPANGGIVVTPKQNVTPGAPGTPNYCCS